MNKGVIGKREGEKGRERLESDGGKRKGGDKWKEVRRKKDTQVNEQWGRKKGRERERESTPDKGKTSYGQGLHY